MAEYTLPCLVISGVFLTTCFPSFLLWHRRACSPAILHGSEADPSAILASRVRVEEFRVLGWAGHSSKLRPGRFILVLTSTEKVVLSISNIGEDKIAASLPDQEWLIPSLDFLIATPLDKLPSQSMGVLTILVDGDIGGSFREQATGVIHRLFPSSFPSSRMTTRQERWFSPSDRDRLSCSSTLQELLASKLPEARSCPGWGDKTFARIMRSFSARGDNVVCQDWSGLVALIPGLVRHALPCAPPPLLVAPESKVHALTQLVQCCAREMGMSEARISKRSFPRYYSVFCNSAAKVDEVVSGMVERGYEAYPVYSQDDAILEKVYEHGLSVVVTNVYNRASQDVINYELPRSDEEYVSHTAVIPGGSNWWSMSLATKS
ncbi:hypothetical protein SELMODRAFT_427814 [Selaginella moellendorffii]|uniref:Uncharacterized protein n=1 Tax=Selaginella moellendorffii TaxID=88036 RepID=D8T0T0_SELML|nr:hypothetical protein SELMODRAFT_427814 [Selaginella moellendorffii]